MQDTDYKVLAYIFALLAISALLALLLDKRRQRRGIGVLPFRWGYFQGIWGIFIGCFLAYTGLVIAAPYLLAGTFVIRRHRWAWVVATVISLNPVLWIVNYLYGKRRWNELISLRPAHPRAPEPAADVVAQVE